MSAGGALSAVSGGASSFVSGGSLSVSGAEGLSAVFGEGAELTASAVRVSSSSVLEASTVGSVSVSGSEGVSVSSGGSLVRLSPEGEGEFVGFAWESARSFDTFENVVSPSVAGVEELVIVSGGGAVRAWRERGVDRPVRRRVVGDGVERVAGGGGVLLAGRSERALRAQSVSGCVCAARRAEPDVRGLGGRGVPLRASVVGLGVGGVGVAHRGVGGGGGERELDGRGGERGRRGGGVGGGGRERERGDVSVASSGLTEVSSRDVSVVAGDRLEAFGGEEVRVTGGAIGVESLGRLDAVAAGGRVADDGGRGAACAGCGGGVRGERDGGRVVVAGRARGVVAGREHGGAERERGGRRGRGGGVGA